MKELAIFCADVGSIRAKKFGWAAKLPGQNKYLSGSSIEEFALRIAKTIDSDFKLAIGFECPLFVPMRVEAKKVNSARNGEGNRSWSAGAGTGALATGLVEVLWVMNKVANHLGFTPKAEFNWESFLSSNAVFIWEAFVSSEAKGVSHSDDAVIAVNTFFKALPNMTQTNAIREEAVLSLAGAAALRAGWSSEIGILSEPCLVIKA